MPISGLPGADAGNARDLRLRIVAVEPELAQENKRAIAAHAGQRGPVVLDELVVRNVLDVIEQILAGRVLLAGDAHLEGAFGVIADVLDDVALLEPDLGACIVAGVREDEWRLDDQS